MSAFTDNQIILKCSSCRKPLVDIRVTAPNDRVATTVSARCCYCGDESFPVTIQGRFAPGWYGVDNPEDSEDSFVQVAIIGKELVDDRVIFLTKQVNQ